MELGSLGGINNTWTTLKENSSYMCVIIG